MPARALDAVDRKILVQLQANGRMSLAELADEVGLSASPCLRRVRMLEKAGVISRYVAVLDQRAVGPPVSVFVSIKLERQKQDALDRFAKAIERWPEVLECYLMTGPRDYWLRVVVPDLAAYERSEAHEARRHRLDRVELRTGAGEVHQCASSRMIVNNPIISLTYQKRCFLNGTWEAGGDCSQEGADQGARQRASPPR
jgi:Lrp/AsnC family transcriptional regulator, leucine-responsive regulatory protein